MELPRTIQVRYLERRKADLHHCKHYLNEFNFQEIVKIGHQLKGNGATFGYGQLSELGSRLEAAAKKGDDEALKKILEEFSEWVDENHLLN